MSSITDMLNLNKLEMFQSLRKILETNGANAIQNLLAYKDQMLYVWNPEECCLYSVLLSTAHEENPSIQVRNLFHLIYSDHSLNLLFFTCFITYCIYHSLLLKQDFIEKL